MKLVTTALIAVFCSAALTTGIFIVKEKKQRQAAAVATIQTMESMVQKQLDDLSSGIVGQLDAFAQTVAANRNFSLRILVENNPSSADITGMAVQFMQPMGFSALEIADKSAHILSCGHFPARSGSDCREKATALNATPELYTENIMGTAVLTLQAKSNFSIANIPFSVMGGVTLNRALLQRLAPRTDVTLLLKNGESYIGMDDIHAISAITNNTIIINDKKYLATSIMLPTGRPSEKQELLIVIDTDKA